MNSTANFNDIHFLCEITIVGAVLWVWSFLPLKADTCIFLVYLKYLGGGPEGNKLKRQRDMQHRHQRLQEWVGGRVGSGKERGWIPLVEKKCFGWRNKYSLACPPICPCGSRFPWSRRTPELARYRCHCAADGRLPHGWGESAARHVPHQCPAAQGDWPGVKGSLETLTHEIARPCISEVTLPVEKTGLQLCSCCDWSAKEVKVRGEAELLLTMSTRALTKDFVRRKRRQSAQTRQWRYNFVSHLGV